MGASSRSRPEPVAAHSSVVTSMGTSGASIEARMLRRLLTAIGDPPVEFQLWNGERVAPQGVEIRNHIRVADRATLLAVLGDPQLRFGDSYSAGKVDIDGDLIEFMNGVYRSLARADGSGSIAQRIASWLHRPKRNTFSGSRDNIHHHYDLGNDFYSLWLGETMSYTCAYYPVADASLEEAQIAKMDHVCRKLRLQAGDNVVEAGCGWGSLAIHMATRFGARVRAFNISREQIAFARRRADQLGLSGQVEFVEDDYRNIAGQYDVFASVGMLEHVGIENYAELGRVVRRSLTDAGRGLIHSIGRNRPAPLHPWIERRIFPGAYAPALSEMMQIFEPNGLSVVDVENIRPVSYTHLTLPTNREV